MAATASALERHHESRMSAIRLLEVISGMVVLILSLSYTLELLQLQSVDAQDITQQCLNELASTRNVCVVGQISSDCCEELSRLLSTDSDCFCQMASHNSYVADPSTTFYINQDTLSAIENDCSLAVPTNVDECLEGIWSSPPSTPTTSSPPPPPPPPTPSSTNSQTPPSFSQTTSPGSNAPKGSLVSAIPSVIIANIIVILIVVCTTSNSSA